MHRVRSLSTVHPILLLSYSSLRRKAVQSFAEVEYQADSLPRSFLDLHLSLAGRDQSSHLFKVEAVCSSGPNLPPKLIDYCNQRSEANLSR